MVQDGRVINRLGAAGTNDAVAEVFKVRGQHELEISAAAIAGHDLKLRHLFPARLFNGRLQASLVLGEVNNSCIASSMKYGVFLRVHLQILAFSC